MIKGKLSPFVAGPPVVERLGQKLTKNELGGWKIQLRCGAVDHAVDTEEEALSAPGRFLPLAAIGSRCAAARPPRGQSKSQGRMAYRCHPARYSQGL